MLLPYPGIDLGNLEEALRHEELMGGMIVRNPYAKQPGLGQDAAYPRRGKTQRSQV